MLLGEQFSVSGPKSEEKRLGLGEIAPCGAILNGLSLERPKLRRRNQNCSAWSNSEWLRPSRDQISDVSARNAPRGAISSGRRGHRRRAGKIEKPQELEGRKAGKTELLHGEQFFGPGEIGGRLRSWRDWKKGEGRSSTCRGIAPSGEHFVWKRSETISAGRSLGKAAACGSTGRKGALKTGRRSPNSGILPFLSHLFTTLVLGELASWLARFSAILSP